MIRVTVTAGGATTSLQLSRCVALVDVGARRGERPRLRCGIAMWSCGDVDQPESGWWSLAFLGAVRSDPSDRPVGLSPVAVPEVGLEVVVAAAQADQVV